MFLHMKCYQTRPGGIGAYFFFLFFASRAKLEPTAAGARV
jgi:hypothetical protein